MTEELTTKELFKATLSLVGFFVVVVGISIISKTRKYSGSVDDTNINVGNIQPAICRDHPDIKYYDNLLDLVFIDKGSRGCEKIDTSKFTTIKKICTTTGYMYYGSGRAEDIKRNQGLYEDREFNRNNYDKSRFFIRK